MNQVFVEDLTRSYGGRHHFGRLGGARASNIRLVSSCYFCRLNTNAAFTFLSMNYWVNDGRFHRTRRFIAEDVAFCSARAHSP